MNSSTNSSLFASCIASEQHLSRNAVIYHVDACILGASLVAILVLISSYCRHRIVLHGNLLVLFASIVAVSFLNNLGFFLICFRHSVLFYTHKSPCDLLAPLWLSAVLLGPTTTYSIAYPALHFCVMVERFRATVLAERYEQEGQRLGYFMVSVIWLISISFTTFIIVMAFLDPDMNSAPQAFIVISSKATSQPILYTYIFFLLLVIFTTFCDWRIYMINKQFRARHSAKYRAYSLSRNYQLNENALTMRLILPLDVLYACLYTLYELFTVVIRGYSPVLDRAEYIFYYNLANTLLYMYSLVTILIYIRFLKFVGRSQKRDITADSKRPEEHAKIYFKQLEAQWQ